MKGPNIMLKSCFTAIISSLYRYPKGNKYIAVSTYEYGQRGFATPSDHCAWVDCLFNLIKKHQNALFADARWRSVHYSLEIVSLSLTESRIFL